MFLLLLARCIPPKRPLKPAQKPFRWGSTPCAFHGCSRRVVAVELCIYHYKQKWNGRPLHDLRRNAPVPIQKTCCRCGWGGPVSGFPGDRTGGNRDEHKGVCKRCAYAATTKWKRNNLETVRAGRRRWYHANSAKVLAAVKAARLRNPEHYKEWGKKNREPKKHLAAKRSRDYYKAFKPKIQVKAKAYRKTHHAEIRARDRKYYLANKPRLRLMAHNWRSKNREKRRAAERKRHGHKNRCPIHVTPAQIQARIDFYGNRCAYCGGPFEHIDHVIPLARGGLHVAANLRPACIPCNCSKRDKSLKEWRRAN